MPSLFYHQITWLSSTLVNRKWNSETAGTAKKALPRWLKLGLLFCGTYIINKNAAWIVAPATLPRLIFWWGHLYVYFLWRMTMNCHLYTWKADYKTYQQPCYKLTSDRFLWSSSYASPSPKTHPCYRDGVNGKTSRNGNSKGAPAPGWLQCLTDLPPWALASWMGFAHVAPTSGKLSCSCPAIGGLSHTNILSQPTIGKTCNGPVGLKGCRSSSINRFSRIGRRGMLKTIGVDEQKTFLFKRVLD